MSDSPSSPSALFQPSHPLDDPNFDPIQYLNETYTTTPTLISTIPSLETLQVYHTLQNETNQKLDGYLMSQRRFDEVLDWNLVAAEQNTTEDSHSNLEGSGAQDSVQQPQMHVLSSITHLNAHLMSLIEEFNNLTNSLHQLTVLKGNIHMGISYLNKYKLLTQSVSSILKNIEQQRKQRGINAGRASEAAMGEQYRFDMVEMGNLCCSALALGEQFEFRVGQRQMPQSAGGPSPTHRRSRSHDAASILGGTSNLVQEVPKVTSSTSSDTTSTDPSTDLINKLTEIRDFILDRIQYEMDVRVKDAKMGDLAWVKTVDQLEQYQPGLRQSVIQRIVKIIIKEYKQAFKKSSDPLERLTSLPNRLKWMKQRLRSLQSKHGDDIPDGWCVRQEVVVDFCLHFRRLVETVLTSKRAEEFNVSLLYKALQHTIAFERSMHEKFHISTLTKLSDARDPDSQQLLYKAQQHASPQKEYNFTGFISPVFSKHMQTAYVNHENINMENIMAEIMQNCFSEREELMGTYSTQTAQDVFIAIEQSCNNCVAFNKTNILYGLIQGVWKLHLNKFSSFLAETLKNISAQNSSKTREMAKKLLKLNYFLKDKNAQQYTLLKHNQVHRVCHIIHLGDYCQREVTAVEEMVTDVIDEEYKPKVTFAEERGGFLRVVKTARDMLVGHLIASVEPSLEKMIQSNWKNPQCMEESEYCVDIVEVLQEKMLPLLHKVPHQYYKTLCQSFIIAFLSFYQESMFKVKQITIAGAQQLLLDCVYLKNYFRNLLSREHFDSEEISFFHKNINQQAHHLEGLLKVLATESHQFLQAYKNCIDRKERNGTEFLHLLDLRSDIDKNEKEILSRAGEMMAT